ncbi:hypothetical protein [Sphingopyxis sp.]|uniref:hypothetical protein n=1 Tax=Sphingopyxis sp. TaxID=1908224 RepID=UPI003D0ED4D9
MRANPNLSPIRNGKRRLLESCAIAAGIAALAYGGPAMAQVAGTGSVVSGSATISPPGPGPTTVATGGAQTVINWTPTDTAPTGGAIDFLPIGNTLNFSGSGNYVVLNRFVNGGGGSLSRQIALNGTVNSTVGAVSGSQGGSIWFYNAGGILIGNDSVINVGSLVLTTNDIDRTGGLFGPGGEIRFRGASGSTAGITVNGEINANQALTPGSSYVALVAPRIVQSGLVDVYGSAAYVAAEQADIRINSGLFDINVLVGAEGGNVITHTGITRGPEQQATGPAQGIYMVAIPKNDAVTMLVSGQVGYQDALSATQTDSEGRIVLSAGYNVTNGVIDVAPVNATAANLTVNDIVFRSDVTGHASGAFVGQPVGMVPTGALPFVPPPNQGRFSIQGSGTFTGDASATLNINAGRAGFVTGDLTVRSDGTATAPGSAAININGGGLLVQGQTSILAPSVVNAATGNAQGGNASLTISAGGLLVATGGLEVSADGYGGLDGTGQASGDGRGGTATVTVTGTNATGGRSTLSGGDVYVHANGYGAIPDPSGTDNATNGGAGFGGNATIRVENGGNLTTTGDVTAEANGQGGFGIASHGDGTGGTSLVEVAGPGATLQAGTTSIRASGSGDGGFSFDPLTGTTIATQAGGNARGGNATLRVSTDTTSISNFGDVNVDASATAGTAGGSFVPSGENATGGNATGGTATVEILGGTVSMSSLRVDAFGQSGGAYTGSGTTGQGGDAQGGTIVLSAANAGSTLNFGGSGSAFLDASGTASSAGRENAGSGTGGQITVSATSGGTISGAAGLLATAFGGSEDIAGLISAGTGTGGTIDFRADSGGTISALFYQARARGGVVNTIGNNGNARGGNITLTAQSGGSIIATADGTSSFDVSAVDGVSADGSAADGGNITLTADGGTISMLGLSLSADALSGSDDTGSTSQANGGFITITTGTDPDSLIAVDFIDATANALAGANYDGFFSTPGEARGGIITVNIQGGSLTTGVSSLSGITLAADGTGGIGNAGTGGTIDFTQTGGTVDVSNLMIHANGQGGRGGDGFGGFTTLTLSDGTFTAGTASLSANGFGGQGLNGNDFDPSSPVSAGNGGNGYGGNATIQIEGTAVINTALLDAYAAGNGGRGGDYDSYGNVTGAGGNGGFGQGGIATINLVSGDLTSDAVVADSGGLGGSGGNVFTSFSGGPSTGRGVGGNAGDGLGGTSTLNLRGATLTIGESLTSQSVGEGGSGGYGTTGGAGGRGFGGIAQSIVDNYDAGALPLFLDSSAVGGAGGTGFDGSGGNGGDAQGGTSRAVANGANGAMIVSQGNFRTDATGGLGGSAFTDFSSTPATAGRGGDGGFGYGGTIEVVANDGATVTLGTGSTGGDEFSSTGTGGDGGRGADNPNTITLPGPDGILGTADDITQGLVGGDGGFGGGGIGGTVRLLANGGTITSNGAPVTITVGGVSGVGGDGGVGSGGNGSCCSIAFGDQGGRVIFEALANATGPGQISLGDTVIQANGGLAGRIEMRTDSQITMTSLDAQAYGFAQPTNNDTDTTPAGIFLAATGGSIRTTGDMVLRTDSSVGAYAQASGQVSASGNLTIEAGDQVDLRHEFRAEDETPTLFAAGDLSITAGTSISGAPGTLIESDGNMSLTAGSIGLDRVGSFASLSAIATTGGVTINNAEIEGNIGIFAQGDITGNYSAGGDAFLSSGRNIVASVNAAGGFPEPTNSDVRTAGNVYIDAAGNVTLNDSSATGMFGVNAQSVALTNVTAGEDMLVLAQGTANLSGITVGDDLDVRATGAITATNVSATGLGPDGFFLDYSPSGGFTISQGEGQSALDGSDIDLQSSTASIDATNLSAGDDIFLNALTTIALNGATTLGLGTTGGDSSIRTTGGDTTLAGLNAFSNVVVGADGTANVTGTVRAGNDVTINANAVTLADIPTSGAPIDTITAGRDIAITSVADISGGGILTAGRSLTLDAGGAIDITQGESGDDGEMTLTGVTGIQADQLYSRGLTTLTADNGDIRVGNLGSLGEVSISANSLDIGTNGPITFANIDTDAGDATIRSNNRMIVNNATIAGTARFSNSGEHLIVNSLTANAAEFNANEMLSMTSVSVATSLIADAGTTIAIDGVVTGRDISLASADIDITSTGRVGTEGVTQSLTLENNDDEQQTFVGGTGSRNGYHVDTAELTRLFGRDIEIFAPEVDTVGQDSIGSAAPPDVIVDTFTMTGGTSGSNLGTNGSLTITTPGKMRVIGNVQLTGLSNDNALNLNADDALEVILGQGTIRLLGANNAPGGQLNMASDDIIVATAAAITDVGNATTTDAINTRLGQNDGIVLDEGALFARGIRFSVSGGVYVQNSGAGTDFGQRRGLTFGDGGLSITPSGSPRVVINGVQIGPNGQITGLDVIPALSITPNAAGIPGTIDPRSTFNGCLIANTGSCTMVSFEPTNLFPVQDVVEDEDGNGDSGDGTSLPTALITMRDLDPLTGEPLLDDPVTGAGNDDLWTPTTDSQQP